MKITCYRTAAYKNTDTYEVPVIRGTAPPEDRDDEERELLKNGGEPMCSFTDAEGMCHFVPWSFVISIEE